MRTSKRRSDKAMSPRAEVTFDMISERPSKDAGAPLLAACRHLLQTSGRIVGKDVAEAILPSFPTFCSAIPTGGGRGGGGIALASIDGRAPLTHDRVNDFCVNVYGPVLHSLGFGKGDRIALVLPNGPELALAIFATSHWASCVPLSANGALSELEADLLRCSADLVVGPYSGRMSRSVNVDERFRVSSSPNRRDWSAFRTIEECASRLGIPFVGLVPSPEESGIFRLMTTRLPHPLHFDKVPREPPTSSLPLPRKDGMTAARSTEPNGAEDEILVLFTSGTTGNKKLVPHRMGDMLTAAATIALSWDLSPSDVNCNLMPLFHVGGIVRQVFSPIFSGGCVICCPSFDPSIFWTLLAKGAFTWYYAAPTMHQLILQTGKSDGWVDDDGVCPLKLRMIANAAGGLLPSLAKEMLQVFGATVSESFG